jgi:hypothetical protein
MEVVPFCFVSRDNEKLEEKFHTLKLKVGFEVLFKP